MERLLADAGVDHHSIDEEKLRVLSARLADRDRRDEGAFAHEMIADWLDSLAETYGKRWPVIRSGERAPIPRVVRLSVYIRDGFMCQNRTTGSHSEDLELDHCIPWSAGGPDDTDNLRTLCSRCNGDRSNYIDEAHEQRIRPTTWWCLDCYSSESSRYHGGWKDGTQLGIVPLIELDECGPIEQVYCAFCDHPTMSPLFFSGARGKRLIRQVWVPETHPDREIHRPAAIA